MVIVDKLLGKSGEARKLLGFTRSGILDLSVAKDWNRLEVLRGLAFSDVLVSNVEIYLNFVACQFRGCTFRDVCSTAHFWSGENVWSNCSFHGGQLEEMISPMNTFRECKFDRLSVIKFEPYQTLFENCLFLDVSMEGMKARLVDNRTKRNPDLVAERRGTVVFRKCRFERTTFQQSYFDGIVFDNCEFEGVSAEGCDFRGITCETKWWGEQKSDPFTVFLGKALRLIEQKCGKNSRAYEAFENYVLDFKGGKTTSKDFSACLYSKDVPYREVQKVEDELTGLTDKFSF